VTAARPPIHLLVLADDLIWSTRLVAQAREAGAEARSVRSADAFARELPSMEAAIVDLTSRTYDGLAAIAAARDARVPVLAVGQHDDHVLRRDALSVGADRVLAYRKFFDDGPATIARWLAASVAPVAPAEPEQAATR
jgi:DNA-binding response OmpR family regulator